MGAGASIRRVPCRVGKLTGASTARWQGSFASVFGALESTRTPKCVYSPEPVRDAQRAGKDVFERVEPAAALTPENADNPPGVLGTRSAVLPDGRRAFGLRIAHEA